MTLPASTLDDIAKLISAIFWPAVVLVLIFLLREPLKMLARRIGTSARRVSIGVSGVSVEFAAAVSEVQTQDSTVLDDLRRPTPQLLDSAADTLFDQLAAEEPAPYVLVDLGEGREWLTTRLYLFAVMLSGMRRTRWLVFVATVAGVRERFIGVAAAQAVRLGLARQYPWLEADYAEAYANATTAWRTNAPAGSNPASPTFVLDDHGRLVESVAQQVIYNFLFAVKPPQPAISGPEIVNETVQGFQLTEHARWVNGTNIEAMLGSSLDRGASIEDSTAASPAEIAANTLPMKGHEVIALVDGRHRFTGLVVERTLALDALALESGGNGAIADPIEQSSAR